MNLSIFGSFLVRLLNDLTSDQMLYRYFEKHTQKIESTNRNSRIIIGYTEFALARPDLF